MSLLYDNFDDIATSGDIYVERIKSIAYSNQKILYLPDPMTPYHNSVDNTTYTSPPNSLKDTGMVLYSRYNLNEGIVSSMMSSLESSTAYAETSLGIFNQPSGNLRMYLLVWLRAAVNAVAIGARSNYTSYGAIYSKSYQFNDKRWRSTTTYMWRDTNLGGYRVVCVIEGNLILNVLVKFSKVEDIGNYGYVEIMTAYHGWIDNLYFVNKITDETKEYFNSIGYDTVS